MPVLPQRGLVDIELVGVDGALDNRLAESIGARDEDHVAKTGFGVQREHDATGADVTAHHLLHTRRQRDLIMTKALVDAVGYRAVVVK